MKELKLKLTLIEPMLGTIPKNRNLCSDYIANEIATRRGKEKGPSRENIEEELITVEALEEKGYSGFHSDDKGIFVYDYLVKGFLKEASNVLKLETGVKNSRSKVDSLVFVFPRRVHCKREGKVLKNPDGVLERSLRASTPQGPKVALAKSDFISEGSTLDVTIKYLQSVEITENYLRTVLDYGCLKGLGQFRNGSYGRFTYEVL